MPLRHRMLPRTGVLIVNTDLHGNAEDFARLEEIFHAERTVNETVHWTILGDIVHAPNPEARASEPALYDFPDGSFTIAKRIADLKRQFPEQVHFVLGNHDFGHVGGPRTGKFHRDEVAALETTLGEEERNVLHGMIEDALLLVAAPCGVLLTHGSPDPSLVALDMFDAGSSLRSLLESRELASALRSLLCSYGQPKAIAAAMLAQLSRGAGCDLQVVLHGHDKTEHGFFYEGGNQVCPCIFGAPKPEKRYVRLDLGARYERAEDLRDAFEIRRLWG